MSIFTSGEGKYPLATERGLTEALKANPTYPFVVKDNVLVLEYYLAKMWFYLLAVMVLFPATVVYLHSSSETKYEFEAYFIGSLLFSIGQLCCSLFRRRIEIDHEKQEYRYVVSNYVKHRGPLNQIYIRMVAKEICPGRTLYKLVLNGHKIDSRGLCEYSDKSELLELQGNTMAIALNLNYFDYMDVSSRHKIIHRPKKRRKAHSKLQEGEGMVH